MTELHRTTEDFTKEERERLLSQFDASGLAFQQFAREHNIHEQTFKNWLWIRKRPPDYKVQHFTPVERKKIVESYLSSGMRLTEFSKAWGVGGSTLSKWVCRYQESGSDGLMHPARRADDGRLGMKVPRAVQDEIINVKKAKPSFGLKSIKQWLYRDRGIKVSTGTIRKTMKAEGLPLAIKPKKRKRSSEKIRRFERSKPMQLWQSDITQFTMGPSSMRVYLTVFMDDHSRYIVGWRLQSRQTAELVIDAFKDAMVRFGKPQEVLTDQGRQYFAWRGKSELEKLLEKEGIKHVVSRAHHPQTLGKCERFWETVANEFWTRIKPQDLEETRIRIGHFINHYNHQRPHQGLNGEVPADRFFGIAEEVREIIEKSVSENSLRIAIGELPRKPAFLIGQVGDQKIAFHGTSGDFYLTHEKNKGDENGEQRISVSDYAIKPKSESQPTQGSDGRCDAKEPARLVGSDQLPCNPSSGFVGPSDNGRAWTSSENSSDNIGVLDGSNIEDRGFDEARDAANPILANEQSSDCRNDGGLTDTAETQEEG